jgi:hypothetical protein
VLGVKQALLPAIIGGAYVALNHWLRHGRRAASRLDARMKIEAEYRDVFEDMDPALRDDALASAARRRANDRREAHLLTALIGVAPDGVEHRLGVADAELTHNMWRPPRGFSPLAWLAWAVFVLGSVGPPLYLWTSASLGYRTLTVTAVLLALIGFLAFDPFPSVRLWYLERFRRAPLVTIFCLWAVASFVIGVCGNLDPPSHLEPVHVTMRSGPPVDGALIALGTQAVVLGSCRRLVEIPMDRVARVDVRAAPSGGGPPSVQNVVGIGRRPHNPPDPSACALSAKR